MYYTIYTFKGTYFQKMNNISFKLYQYKLNDLYPDKYINSSVIIQNEVYNIMHVHYNCKWHIHDTIIDNKHRATDATYTQ